MAVQVERAKATLAAQEAAGRASSRPTPILMQKPKPPRMQVEVSGNPLSADALAIPYRLPSSGLFETYQRFSRGFDGIITISPTRGEQEEALAGAVDSPESQLMILRQITSQCFNLRGIPYEELLLLDWTAAMLHFLALSAGQDTVNLPFTHAACGAQNDFSRAMTELPHTVLRLDDPTEEKPPTTEGESPEEAVLREMEGGEAPAETVRFVTAEGVTEPFTSLPLPMTNEVISWRHHRVSDLIKAEEFSTRLGDANVAPGGKMYTFLTARQIVAINGRPLSPLEAIGWVRRQPTPILNALREQIKAHEFGYDVAPKFRCRCGARVKVRIELSGELFRAPTRS